MSDSLTAITMIGLQDNVLIMVIEILLKILYSITAFGEIAMVIEWVEDGVINDGDIGGAQNFVGRKFVGGDGAGRLSVQSEAVFEHIAHTTVLLKAKKPAPRKSLEFNSLFLANINDSLATHGTIIHLF